MVPLKPFVWPRDVVSRECRVQFPKPCFKGLKSLRWGCDVLGGCRGKFGHPNCMRLVGREARGSNSCVRSSAQGCCQPYLGCVRLVRVRLVRVGFAVLLDEAVVFVWVASAVERDISKDSIRQAEIAFSAQ